ncbi:uncharacterized protein DSM5745_04861 [Aspergillus mulundensis]|uniref:Uncharacterized protein n=1 Tax=Aspergillus mulundensis TaxID=1810919 RepID=A0A3D8S5L3_9EURO|nr:hypothetical protein DSM5745_04861 [Aspergillus mulundensis]RDW81304.1 hypothetical protein DSM5745_04861 [Aspergillus mulundensis]
MLLDFQQCHPDWVTQDIPKLKENCERFINERGKNLLHEHFPTSQTTPNTVLDGSRSFGGVARQGTGDSSFQKITRKLTERIRAKRNIRQ